VHHDGRGLRIGIIHARWNDKIIEPLLAGTKAKLLECGVQESNIVVQSVPGSWELPLAVQRFVVSPEPSLPVCAPMANSDLGLTN
jgi:6,7-dimethyl-8-ribityllumazine synthase